jgi:hypothetical protein
MGLYNVQMKSIYSCIGIAILGFACVVDGVDGPAAPSGGGVGYVAVIPVEQYGELTDAQLGELASGFAEQVRLDLINENRCCLIVDSEDLSAVRGKEKIQDGGITFCGAPAIGAVNSKHLPSYAMHTYCSDHKEYATEILKWGFDQGFGDGFPWDPVYKDL